MPSTLYMWNAHEGVPPAANFAGLTERNGRILLAFDDTTEEHYRFCGRIPLNASLGSGVKVRLTWIAATATSGNVRWGAKLERRNTDADADSFDTAAEAHSATDATAGIPVTTEITLTNIDGLTAGDPFILDVYRDASDTTNDTVTGDAQLESVELQEAA